MKPRDAIQLANFFLVTSSARHILQPTGLCEVTPRKASGVRGRSTQKVKVQQKQQEWFLTKEDTEKSSEHLSKFA
jgi:hypothetical protein